MTQTSLHTEQELLLKVADGDEQAFTLLFRQWQPFLATHLYRITESKELTEEIVQDVFLKIWLTRETLPEIRSFKSFLLVVSKNHALNALQKLAREFKNKEQWLKEGGGKGEPDPTPAFYSLLDEAIDQLTGRQRQVYLLHRQGGLTYQEIADKLGIGKESVKTHIGLAIKHITRYVHGKLATAILLFWLQR